MNGSKYQKDLKPHNHPIIRRMGEEEEDGNNNNSNPSALEILKVEYNNRHDHMRHTLKEKEEKSNGKNIKKISESFRHPIRSGNAAIDDPAEDSNDPSELRIPHFIFLSGTESDSEPESQSQSSPSTLLHTHQQQYSMQNKNPSQGASVHQNQEKRSQDQRSNHNSWIRVNHEKCEKDTTGSCQLKSSRGERVHLESVNIGENEKYRSGSGAGSSIETRGGIASFSLENEDGIENAIRTKKQQQKENCELDLGTGAKDADVATAHGENEAGIITSKKSYFRETAADAGMACSNNKFHHNHHHDPSDTSFQRVKDGRDMSYSSELESSTSSSSCVTASSLLTTSSLTGSSEGSKVQQQQHQNQQPPVIPVQTLSPSGFCSYMGMLSPIHEEEEEQQDPEEDTFLNPPMIMSPDDCKMIQPMQFHNNHRLTSG